MGHVRVERMKLETLDFSPILSGATMKLGGRERPMSAPNLIGIWLSHPDQGQVVARSFEIKKTGDKVAGVFSLA